MLFAAGVVVGVAATVVGVLLGARLVKHTMTNPHSDTVLKSGGEKLETEHTS